MTQQPERTGRGSSQEVKWILAAAGAAVLVGLALMLWNRSDTETDPDTGSTVVSQQPEARPANRIDSEQLAREMFFEIKSIKRELQDAVWPLVTPESYPQLTRAGAAQKLAEQQVQTRQRIDAYRPTVRAVTENQQLPAELRAALQAQWRHLESLLQFVSAEPAFNRGRDEQFRAMVVEGVERRDETLKHLPAFDHARP